MQKNKPRYELSIFKAFFYVLTMVVIQVILNSVSFFQYTEGSSSIWYFIEKLGIQLISYVVFIYVFYFCKGQIINMDRVKRASKGLIVSIALLLAIFSTSVIMPLVSKLPMQDRVAKYMEALLGHPFLAIFIIAVFAPVFEEIIFRGIILKGLLAKYPKVVAVIVSSLLFGAFHLNLQQFISATVIGVFAGVIYERTRSIRYTIIFHSAYNFFVIVSGTVFEILKVNYVVYPISGIVTISGVIYLLSKFRPVLAPIPFDNSTEIHIEDYPSEYHVLEEKTTEKEDE